MGVKIGLEGKLYRGTAGSTAGTEITNAKDVALKLNMSEADHARRGDAGWDSTSVATIGAELTFGMVYDSADASFVALKNAALNRTPLAFANLDGTGGKGMDADFVITGFGRDEPLKAGMTVPVTCKNNNDIRVPVWPD